MKMYTYIVILLMTSYCLMSQIKPSDKDGNGFINISTIDELRWVSENSSVWGNNFELDNNIDASDTKVWNNGNGFIPIKEFTGNFEGNHFEISNLNIIDTNLSSTGLFGKIEANSKIKNLTIRACNIVGRYTTGGVVGYSQGKITNCNVSGNIEGIRSVGGLVGINFGLISQCLFEGKVKGDYNVGGVCGENADTLRKCTSSGSVEGNRIIGGLVGYNINSKLYCNIIECYSVSEVSGNSDIGGLVGINTGIVNESYSTGIVSGDERIGGLVGGNSQEFVFDSFWDIESSGLTISSGGIGKYTNELKKETIYTDLKWDFEDTWQIDETVNEGYPFFKWEIITSVETFSPDLSLVIYPNPASEFIKLDLDAIDLNSEVKIYNAYGRLEITLFNKSDKIDISMLTAGVYIVKIGTKSVMKFVKL